MYRMKFFSEEMKGLEDGSVHVSSKILSLDPFVVEYGLLRVGGRIQTASLFTVNISIK